MSLTISGEGGGEALPKLEQGIYLGTCYRIVDMGTTDQEYQGTKSKKTRVHITFEIAEALDPKNNETLMPDGRPFVVSKTYTASLYEMAALRKDLQSWRGISFTEEELKGFDITKLLGCTARIEVGHTKPMPDGSGGGNQKILSLQRPDGGIQQAKTQNEQEIFDLDVYCDFIKGNKTPDGQAMADIYETLPPWQQEDISSSYEFIAAAGQSTDTTMADDLSNLTDQAAAEMNSDDFDSDDSKGGLTEDNIPF